MSNWVFSICLPMRRKNGSKSKTTRVAINLPSLYKHRNNILQHRSINRRKEEDIFFNRIAFEEQPSLTGDKSEYFIFYLEFTKLNIFYYRVCSLFLLLPLIQYVKLEYYDKEVDQILSISIYYTFFIWLKLKLGDPF